MLCLQHQIKAAAARMRSPRRGICLEFFSRRSIIIINEFVSSLQQRRAVAAA